MKALQLFTTSIVLVSLLLAGYMVYYDGGNSAGHTAGAGDIWWADVPVIEETFNKQNVVRRSIP